MDCTQSSAIVNDDANEWKVFQSKSARRKDWYRQQHIPRAPPLPDALDRAIAKATRHDFKPSLAFRRATQDDKTFLDAGKPYLKDYNTERFARFNNPLDISPLFIRPQYNNRLGVETHYFAVERVGLIARLPLFLVSSDDHEHAQLCVALGDTFQNFFEWLGSLPDPGTFVTGVAGYEALYRYHRTRSDLHAPNHTFSTMPEDIQKEILLHMVGEVQPVSVDYMSWPVVTHRIGGGRNNDYRHPWGWTISVGPPTIEPLNSSVLCLDKKTHHMVEPILKYWTIKSFMISSDLSDIIRHSNKFNLSSLTKIQLCFTDWEYLGFFGVNLVNTPVTHGPFDADVLLELPNLHYLELWCDCLIDAQESNPWYHEPPSHHSGHGWQFPCRKGMVDAIMVAALPYIQHVASINLTGYVKTESREFWLKQWAQKSSDSFRAAMEEKKAALNLPPHLQASPLRCKCPVSCYYPDLANNAGNEICRRPNTSRIKAEKQACKEAIEKYRFDFDDEQTPEYREVDFFPGKRTISEEL